MVKNVSFSLPVKVHKEIKLYCTENNITMKVFFRKILVNYLKLIKIGG